jgi:hypothetical protein
MRTEGADRIRTGVSDLSCASAPSDLHEALDRAWLLALELDDARDDRNLARAWDDPRLAKRLWRRPAETQGGDVQRELWQKQRGAA